MIITPLDKLSKMVLEELLDHLGLPYILVIALPVEQSSFEVISSFEKEHVLPLLKKVCYNCGN